MRRQISGLHAADRCAADQIPDGVFLVRVHESSFDGRHRSLLHSDSGHSRAQPVCRARYFEPPLLQPESPVEAELVPARLRLRHRTARPGRSGRNPARGSERRGQDQPHRLQRRFPAPTRRFCPRRPLGRTFPGESRQPAGGLNDLQLHSDQPVPDLPAALSASLSRWLEGKGHPGCDALRPGFRTSPGRLFSPGRPGAVLFSEWSPVRTKACTTRTETPGIACCSKASAPDRFCQDDRVRSASLDAICRSSSPGQFWKRTTLSPTSMPSADWTERAV